MGLRARLGRLERDVLTPAGRCTDAWHRIDALAVRQVDYRIAAAPLMDGYVAPAAPPAPDRCPSCGVTRPVIEIRAMDVLGAEAKATATGRPASGMRP